RRSAIVRPRPLHRVLYLHGDERERHHFMMAAAAMVATALIYSGRPNPSWTLAPATTAEVTAALKALPALPDGGRAEPGLGYSGMMLDVSAPGDSKATWTFSKGVATQGDHRFSDAGRKVERLLIESGRMHIDQQIFSQLLDQ